MSLLLRKSLLAFVLLLFLVIGAVPVLADSPEPPPVQGEEEVSLPTAADVAEGLAEAEDEEREEEEALATPEAIAEREKSRDAYADLSGADALTLLATQFAEQLEILNTDPARLLSDAKLEHTLGETAAAVTYEGDSQVLDAGIPVRTEDEEGDLSKVDLSLEPTVEGFETANALSDVAIPTSAAEGVEIGEGGLAIAQAGADPASTGRRLGDKNVFFPEVHTDTDLLVSPTSTGVELFDQLRSAESPEELRFAVALPAGATLREDGEGGAEVVAAGERVAFVPPPHALDAQGADVPVSMRVEGDSLVLSVAHREAEFAYPILVDPIAEDWYNGANSWYAGGNLEVLWPTFWPYVASSTRFSGQSTPIYATFGGSNRGLFINASSTSGAQLANKYGQYTYTAPGTSTYISLAMINPFWRDDHGCGIATYPEPHDYSGLWAPAYGWADFHRDQARVYGYGINQPSTEGPNGWLAKTGHILVIGLGTGETESGKIPCARDLYAGGVTIVMDDWEAPALNSPTGMPSGWVGAATPFTISAQSSDAGLGVRRVTISPEGAAVIQDQVGGCTGLITNPCPATRTSQFNLTGASFDEGIKKALISAEDPTGKASTSYEWQMKVDRTPPSVTLSGQFGQALAEAGQGEAQGEGGPELSLPVFNVKVEATDGSNASNAQKRSGVKSIEVFLDGTLKESWSQTATEDSRPMTKTYPLKLIDITAGIHKLKIVTKDQLEQPRVTEKEFEYTPATGMKDDYVLQHFALPDGQDHSDEQTNHGPELAVNLMNGNVVYHERDVHVEGVGADLDLERFYNSQLPSAQNTEWGDGWTLAQTPELDPVDTGGSPAPDEAELLDTSGAVDDGIKLPVEVGKEEFDPGLQSTVTKEGSGYALSDESGQTGSTVAFDAAGQTQELRLEGGASVEYDYEGGELAEVAVEDPMGSLDPPPAPPSVPASTTTPSYVSAFGASGAGNGQLNHPADAAFAANGNLWVVDENNNRIEQFTPGGQFVSKVGSAGSGNAQFNRPTSIAINAKGNILVTDAGNKRVQVFNGKGEFVKAFGSAGTGNGQFAGSGPEGIAVDAKGSVWVCDTYGGRLEKFSEGGEFLKAVGTKGSGSGQLGEPTGVDVAADGRLWVTDWQNNRVAVFTEGGEFVRQFGASGTANGQFSHPDGIDIDSRGTVWVLDQGNGRIQGFNQASEYVTKFGASGSGSGQFSFSYPAGLLVSARGQFWIADTNNNRVQRWSIPGYVPSYSPAADSSFGAAGSGDGQLNLPADIAVDAKGNLWVVDSNNNRVQKFSQAGAYVSKFRTPGPQLGRLTHPTAIALDVGGNLWVADQGNRRVEKFTEAGAYVSKFGGAGSGNGQFGTVIEDLAITPDGKIWVSDTTNNRLQVFNENGEFVKVVGSAGSGPGQLQAPRGLAVDQAGNIWVADSGNNRLEKFGPDGSYLGQFGSEGAGNGQFKGPSAVDVDRNGVLWVMDTGNNRVQTFDEAGGFIGVIGSGGSGAGQFSLTHPSGIAADSSGQTWITDSGNSRIQKWVTPAYAADEQALEELQEPDDASAEVDTSAGLVTSVDPDGEGESTYAYSADDLIAHKGPAGETKYEYDSGGRLTKVTLPNGTVATVKYDATYHRPTSVTVDPAGAEPARTTLFTFKDETRETEVQPPAAPVVVYHFGADGSLLTWSNVVKPPEFDDVAGSLWAERETAAPIASGDKNLLIQAHSDEGISEIKVLIQGDQIADEKQCQQTEAPGIECKDETLEWVTNTAGLEPGIVQVEAVITDRLGAVASQRFWVNVPVPPAVATGTPEVAKFAEIVNFREEFGLDLDLNPVKDELVLHDRIFDLIGAWYNPSTPLGAVARNSSERWGVPLRPIDVAEMEYREWYVGIDGPIIQKWGEDNFPNTYAGYYVDHRAGGILYVGFTSSQSERVAALQQSGALIAPSRVRAFPFTPAYSLNYLESLEAAVVNASISMTGVTGIQIDIEHNRVDVGAVDVSQTTNALQGQFGTQAPIYVHFQAQGASSLHASSTWGSRTGPTKGGERIWGEEHGLAACSIGYGAWDRGGVNPDGSTLYRHFILTAGHCFWGGEKVYQFNTPGEDPEDWWERDLGYVRRDGWVEHASGYGTDAEAIRVEDPGLVPRLIRWSPEQNIRIRGVTTPREGMVVCVAGSTRGRSQCGAIDWPPETKRWEPEKGENPILTTVPYKISGKGGDSGGPIWEPGTGLALGTHTGGEEEKAESNFTPLEGLPGYPSAPGALQALEAGGEPLHLVVWSP